MSEDPSVQELAEKARSETIPLKSKKLYNLEYEKYVKWRDSKNIPDSRDETTFLAYFQVLSEKVVPPTLWSVYSMLRLMIISKENLDIKKFSELHAFIKRKNDGYESKKAQPLTAKNVQDFITHAPDEIYLAQKVIAIFALSGFCRCEETTHIQVNDIESQGEIFVVTLPDTKSNKSRSFVIAKDFCPYIKKYMDLRPADVQSQRFFLRYQNGKCVKQVIGINKVAEVPKNIAKFLKLPNPEAYTGHCFRRTAATLSAEAGMNELAMCNAAGWKNVQTAKRYTHNTMEMKKSTANLLADVVNLPSTSSSNISSKRTSERLNTSKHRSVPSKKKKIDKTASPSDEIVYYSPRE